MRVLGLETSCDETAASIVSEEGVLSDITHSQEIHAEYGGVVPELAARGHVEKVGAVVAAALSEAGVERPDAVAATAGPGLIGAVLVGLNFAKALAAGWGVPFVAVNHLEGHLLSSLLEPEQPQWPFLALVVSGGHTTLYLCHELGKYEILGQTVDDAVGEAYDKVARMMGLGYPGGPVVDRLARSGDPASIRFPRPAPNDYDFSFSGLKTAVRTHLLSDERRADQDVCAAFQAAAVECLVKRVKKAAKATGVHRVVIGGGVAANSGLRAALQASGLELFIPPIHRCTDNAAMIAHAGRLRLLAGQRDGLDTRAKAGWAVAS